MTPEEIEERKRWTEIELEFSRKLLNKDFEKWLKEKEGYKKFTNLIRKQASSFSTNLTKEE